MGDADEPVQLLIQGTLVLSRGAMTALLSEALAQNRELLTAIISTELTGQQLPERKVARVTEQEWPFMPSEFGRILRERREHQRLTRAQLATLSGVADSTIRNIEVGRHRPTARSRLLLVQVFKTLPTGFALPMDGAPRQTLQAEWPKHSFS